MKNNLFRITLAVAIFALISCVETEEKTTQKDKKFAGAKKINIVHAKGFRIEDYKDFLILSVSNPWQGAENVKYEYVLIKNETSLPDFAKKLTKIKIPVKRMVCFSTTHVASIDFIEETNSIVGISGWKYINNQKIREKIANNETIDVGNIDNMNYELLLSLKPDVVMVYGIEQSVASYVAKLGELNIPVIFNADYLENTPLGKTEWVKFVAALYDKIDFVSEKFSKIETEYWRECEKIKDTKNNPTVFCNLPWKETWYVPGGKSYFANLLKDAGAKYLWSENDSRSAIPLNIESIIESASESDFWINTGMVNSKAEILSIDERLENFKAFRNNKIFNNNAKTNQFGGNDFWESGFLYPHLILKDLIQIFHSKTENRELVYYKKVN
ncbi:MAG: hypothetical protein CSA05_02855 [Bacteroidia bacterium]|nr:MAG: hypothetical protein CSA05_02855 [Bacteroidia bacterium]